MWWKFESFFPMIEVILTVMFENIFNIIEWDPNDINIKDAFLLL